jgi:carbamate kinase
VVICGGGGGIPVTIDAHGRHEGVEAVVDKDLTSAEIAIAIDADALLLLTDVDGVYRNFDRHDAERLDSINRTIADSLDLAEGSMRPKVDAGIAFEEATHRRATIGAADQLLEVVAGTAGTTITSDPEPGRPHGR